jgi:uncharacterized damage-inducible protein DinB
MEALQYPIGRFDWTAKPAKDDRPGWIRTIAATPSALRDAIAGLTPEQLDVPYREGGWTIRQVVHHYADDHMNSYVRFKLALTEDAPLIKGYLQGVWAELPDARSGDVSPSLQLLAALHERWVMAWESLSEKDWERTFVHPTRGPVSLEHLAALYAWHGLHHVAQITGLRERKGWK